MNLKEFDAMKKGFEDGDIVEIPIDEIRQTFKSYEESLRLLHNCLLDPGTNAKFWREVTVFLNEKLEEI